ncbi:hypothetical protein V502_07980 [Pseudogymnoascus sp. VKM F-4520 (FW-2644)]|nr:hypothetical protein V502_07980 [Pseudogymnoascus sp. VKM F-4520 (FW-2644)]
MRAVDIGGGRAWVLPPQRKARGTVGSAVFQVPSTIRGLPGVQLAHSWSVRGQMGWTASASFPAFVHRLYFLRKPLARRHCSFLVTGLAFLSQASLVAGKADAFCWESDRGRRNLRVFGPENPEISAPVPSCPMVLAEPVDPNQSSHRATVLTYGSDKNHEALRGSILR